MKMIHATCAFLAVLAVGAQDKPAPAVPATPAAAAPVAAKPAAIEAPTKAKPQFIEGKMSVAASGAVYTKVGRKHDDGEVQVVNHPYPLTVPPHAKLKVELLGRKRNFKVFFIGLDLGKTVDPGLAVNRILGRADASFYENKTDANKELYCVVQGLETMVDEPYKLVFTDF